jgi:hypothetical protein
MGDFGVFPVLFFGREPKHCLCEAYKAHQKVLLQDARATSGDKSGDTGQRHKLTPNSPSSSASPGARAAPDLRVERTTGPAGGVQAGYRGTGRWGFGGPPATNSLSLPQPEPCLTRPAAGTPGGVVTARSPPPAGAGVVAAHSRLSRAEAQRSRGGRDKGWLPAVGTQADSAAGWHSDPGDERE